MTAAAAQAVRRERNEKGLCECPASHLVFLLNILGSAAAAAGGSGGGVGGLTHRRSSSAGLANMRLTSSEVPLDTSIYEALKDEETVLHDYATHLADRLSEVKGGGIDRAATHFDTHHDIHIAFCPWPPPKVSVGVRCVVAYEIAPSVARLIKPPARLFAVRLAFDTDAQYRPIAEIHVPRLVMPDFRWVLGGGRGAGCGRGGGTHTGFFSSLPSLARRTTREDHRGK